MRNWADSILDAVVHSIDIRLSKILLSFLFTGIIIILVSIDQDFITVLINISDIFSFPILLLLTRLSLGNSTLRIARVLLCLGLILWVMMLLSIKRANIVSLN